MNIIKVRFLCEQCITNFKQDNVFIAINSMEELTNIVDIHHIINIITCSDTEREIRHLPNDFQIIPYSRLYGDYYGVFTYNSFFIFDNVSSQDYEFYTLSNHLECEEIDFNNNNKKIY